MCSDVSDVQQVNVLIRTSFVACFVVTIFFILSHYNVKTS